MPVPTIALSRTADAPVALPVGDSPAVRDVAGLEDLLAGLSDAFRSADGAEVARHLHRPGSRFGQSWTARADHMAGLPLASYDLSLGAALPDLAVTAVKDRYEEEVQVVHVVEELALEGFDSVPARSNLFLTVVRGEEGWLVDGVRDAENLGLVSAVHLWDDGPVTVTGEGPVLAVHHPDGPNPGPLVAETRQALEAAGSRWPMAWSRTAVVLVPRDEEQLARMLNVTFDLSDFVAFATATPVQEGTRWELTGSRVVVNPGRFLARAPETRLRILTHELIHVASRPSAGPVTPSWLEEGMAQVLGDQRSATGTTHLDRLSPSAIDLPRDNQFTSGGTQRIHLSYQLAWSFLQHLVSAHGVDRVGEFYRAVGTGSAGQPGTRAHQVQRAAREVFDTSLAELVDAWRATR